MCIVRKSENKWYLIKIFKVFYLFIELLLNLYYVLNFMRSVINIKINEVWCLIFIELKVGIYILLEVSVL